MPPVTRAENPEEELSTGERRISLRVKVLSRRLFLLTGRAHGQVLCDRR
jgi:hypothetical protein